MGELIERRRLLQRIRRAAVPVIALIAPAGYGKSDVARRLAQETVRAVTLDAADARDRDGFLRPLGKLGGAHAGDDPLVPWSAYPEPVTAIVENTDLACDPDVLDALAQLVRRRPAFGTLVLCARRAPRIRLSDLAPPHALLTVRVDDLAFDRAEMAELFAASGADETAIFRASRFTDGWPEMALYLERLVREGSVDLAHDAIPDSLLGELFDYVEAQVLDGLPALAYDALIAAASWTDLTASEIETTLDAPGIVSELVREGQLAAAGDADRLEIHPVIRRTVRCRRGRDAAAVMRRFADTFAALGDDARAAECYLIAGQGALAAASAAKLPGGVLTARGVRAPGDLVDERASELALHAEMLIVLDPEHAIANPADGIPPPPGTAVERAEAFGAAAFGLNVLGLLENGRSAEAVALAEQSPFALRTPADGAESVALAAHLAVLTRTRRYDEALELAERFARDAEGDPAWQALLVRPQIEIARARARWEVEHDALKRIVALARESRAVPVLGLALAESAFGAWFAGEADLFETYRTELIMLVYRHELPALLRFALAASGREPELGRGPAPLWDARAFLLAACGTADAARGAAFAAAALELADAADEPLTRVIARVVGAEAGDRQRTLLREALALAQSLSGSPLRDAVFALLERDEARGMLVPLLRFKRRAQSENDSEGALTIALADGTVMRGGEPVPVSDGVLALLAALAVDSHGSSRERLVDRLWPDLPGDAAYNALKMCVHRARRQLGDPSAVVAVGGGYALAPEVDVDLPWLERMLDRIRRGAVDDEDAPALDETFARLVRGRPAAFGSWEWFDRFESELTAATHELGAYLGERALRSGKTARALEIAQALTRLDPLDERAHRIAMSAHLAAHDRAAAILEYRGYKTMLATELETEPSDDLKRLLEVQ